MECAQCEAKNPDGKRFCGDCGSPLDADLVGVPAANQVRLRQQVKDILRSDFKDQKLAEIELTQAVAARLSDWAKLFAFFVGIPAALLVLTLSLLGFKTYSDFSALVKNGQKDVASKLDDAQKQAAAIKTKADGLTDSFKTLETQLSDATKLSTQVKTLTEKVNRIGEIVGFTASSQLAPEAKKKLETSFYQFQDYLQKVGFQTTGGRVDIDVPKEMPLGALAYYDPQKRLMVIDRKYVLGNDLLYREYMHRVLYPQQEPKGSDSNMWWAYYAIESGLASYFPCSFLNNPKYGEQTAALDATYPIWDFGVSRSFTSFEANYVSAVTDGAQVWGSALWEIRQRLGKDLADPLILKAWFNLTPTDARAAPGPGFVRKLEEMDQALEGGKNRGVIHSVFQRRAWPQ
jgi:hypothetical protein